MRRLYFIIRLACVVVLLLGIYGIEQVMAVPEGDEQTQQRITLSIKEAKIADIIQEIRRTTDYRFLFRSADLKELRKKEFMVTQATIREVMDKLTKNTDLCYTLNGKTVIISERQQITGKKLQEYTISGFVCESEKRLGIPYATVALPELLWGTSAKDDGSFELLHVPSGHVRLIVSSLGMVALDTVILLTADLKNIKFYLQKENFRLKEVKVTARNSKAGKATASHISRTALDHLQATSLQDIMQLLPGGINLQNPNLNYSGQINIRTLSNSGEVLDMNSLGSAIIRDGAPLSNNANLQSIAPAINGAAAAVGGDASPSGGVDVRAISTDNIESIEIIRGIPSVEYGDLTSGAVIIHSKAGQEPFNLRFKTNPNIYQVSASKGFNLKKERGNVHISGDYAYNINKPTESYAFYQRATARIMYSNVFFARLHSNTSLELIYGDNRRKENPDDEKTKLSERARNLGFSFNTNGRLNMNMGWLKNISYTAAVHYLTKKSYEERIVGDASYPYSMTTTDGAILSSRPGVDIWGEDGVRITHIPQGEENLYAYYLPNNYLMRYDIDGREISVFAKIMANFSKQGEHFSNRIIVGADFKSDGNLGRGKTFSPTAPPLRVADMPYTSFRPLAYRDIPFVNQAGIFAEENFRYTFADRQFNLQLGVRYDKIFNSKEVFAPRLNASLDILPDLLTLRGGYGITAKAPTMLYLHPENAYFEFVNFNNMGFDGVPEEQSFVVTTTRVFDAHNKDLEIAKNRKAELGFDFHYHGIRLSLTAFREHMKNGYSLGYDPSCIIPVDYKLYYAGVLPEDGVTLPQLVPEGNYKVLVRYQRPQNNMTIHTDGLELDLDLGRFDRIRMAFSVSGAWMRTKEYNNDYTYYNEGISWVGDAPHVGIYEKGMQKSYRERMATTFRATHNIPAIGLVITLAAQVLWKEADWYTFGNDSIPISYISKEDGKIYPFKPEMTEDWQYTSMLRQVNHKEYVRETMPPALCMNLYVTKEIRDFLRVSFFANNMFKSHPMYESKRAPGTFIKRNNDLFFGLELSLTIR